MFYSVTLIPLCYWTSLQSSSKILLTSYNISWFQYFLSNWNAYNKGQEGIYMVRLWSLFGLKPFNGKQRRKRLTWKKGVFNGCQLDPGFETLHTLIQQGYTFYWNDACIQPGDKKSKKQQIKLLFNDFQISSCVNFEYQPLNTHLQCFFKALLYWNWLTNLSQSCYF